MGIQCTEPGFDCQRPDAPSDATLYAGTETVPVRSGDEEQSRDDRAPVGREGTQAARSGPRRLPKGADQFGVRLDVCILFALAGKKQRSTQGDADAPAKRTTEPIHRRLLRSVSENRGRQSQSHRLSGLGRSRADATRGTEAL